MRQNKKPNLKTDRTACCCNYLHVLLMIAESLLFLLDDCLQPFHLFLPEPFLGFHLFLPLCLHYLELLGPRLQHIGTILHFLLGFFHGNSSLFLMPLLVSLLPGTFLSSAAKSFQLFISPLHGGTSSRASKIPFRNQFPQNFPFLLKAPVQRNDQVNFDLFTFAAHFVTNKEWVAAKTVIAIDIFIASGTFIDDLSELGGLYFVSKIFFIVFFIYCRKLQKPCKQIKTKTLEYFLTTTLQSYLQPQYICWTRHFSVN